MKLQIVIKPAPVFSRDGTSCIVCSCVVERLKIVRIVLQWKESRWNERSWVVTYKYTLCSDILFVWLKVILDESAHIRSTEKIKKYNVSFKCTVENLRNSNVLMCYVCWKWPIDKRWLFPSFLSSNAKVGIFSFSYLTVVSQPQTHFNVKIFLTENFIT